MFYMTHTKLCVSGPTASFSSIAWRWRGRALTLGLVLGVGCTQDYEINAMEGDDAVASSSPTNAVNPAGGGSGTPSVEPSANTANGVVGSATMVPGGPETDPMNAGHGPRATPFDRGLYVYDPVEPSAGAVEAHEDPEQREREDLFEIESDLRTPIVDFLFVVDNSTSMGRIRDLVRSGLVSLYDEDAFPADARIAVMSTIPANPSDLTQLHPRVNDQGGQVNEPGFLRLVDAEGIDRFRAKSPELGEAFRFDGCENAWFTPWEENDEGVPCMVAHTQISRTPVRVEAGLSAFQQFLQKRDGQSTFREGAAVHVIFVSDTHSPGLAGGANRVEKTGLEVDPITYRDLHTLVSADNLVGTFKVHAIAPATECVEEWAHLGPRYFNVADASGGSTLDICTAEDYAPFIRELVEDSDVIEAAILSLGRPSAAVHQVLLDGVSVPFEVVGNGAAVRVNGLNGPRGNRRLTVNYRY